METWSDNLNINFDFTSLSLSKSKSKFYPDKSNIFKIFHLCPLNDIKVVILGMDPYYNGIANGIAFSVDKNTKIPGSLRNIFKEIKNVYPEFKKTDGDLTNWVKQGVFLYNTALTVEHMKPGSHIKLWEQFTQNVIETIQQRDNIIFCLWGKYAEKYETMITNKTCKILKSSHPSGLSCYKTNRPFIGSNVFLNINILLKEMNKDEIKW